MESRYVSPAHVLVAFADQWIGEFQAIKLYEENSHISIRLVNDSRDLVISLDAKDHRLYVGSSLRLKSEEDEEWFSTPGKWGRPQTTIEQFAATDPLMSSLDWAALAHLGKTINIRDPKEVFALLESIASMVHRYIQRVLNDQCEQIA